MGVADPRFPAAILPSLREGSFPSSDDLLTTEVSQDNLPAILDEVSVARKELSEEISSTCRGQGKDVDEWIAQAKKVQADIARWKAVAREIVNEHEKDKELEAAVQDAQAKVRLLEDEIVFSSSIQEELENVRVINDDLDTIETCLRNGASREAAGLLKELRTTFISQRSSRTMDLFNAHRERLAGDTHVRLEAALGEQIKFGKDNGTSWVEIGSEGVATIHDLDSTLEAFQDLETLHKITTNLTARLDEFIIHPLLMSAPQACFAASTRSTRLSLDLRELGSEPRSALLVLDAGRTVIQFLHSKLPELVRVPIVAHLLPSFVSKLVKDLLIPSVPFDLADVKSLSELQAGTREMADLLLSFQWPCYQELFDWIDQAPSMWLMRRKTASLHGVREALSSPRGPLRQVERAETETVSNGEARAAGNSGTGDTDEKLTSSSAEIEDDEASGWDFDEADDETPEKPNGEQQTGDDGSEDAWGWGDEDKPDSSAKQKTTMEKKTATNGLHNDNSANREITLVETYTITDIPDYLLEIIGRDILDAQTVKDPQYSALGSASPSEGLMTLPHFVLVMFRATATTYYTTTLNSGNMHLYNDSMYIVQKLREASLRTDAIESDCKIMERFGRSAYAREMEIQRTILGDLLDGAQGFVSCTKLPNSNECEIAVTSAVDRIRAVHAEWSTVLSHSALLQSIGSLMSAVLGKVIQDVEDMDDISEPESKRLTSFCNQLSALEDIFIPAAQDDAVALTALYVPNWLKFQFLINILEASLVDIKWLWTEGQMSLEFDADEVVDLIKALFAESTHRRNAITAIRQHPGASW